MVKRSWLLGIFIGISLIGILTGFFLFHRQVESSMVQQMQVKSSDLDLGIVYLPVTQRVADYYRLGVDSGAMVTQVSKGSPVDQAGIKVGEVITAFNGIQIGDATPLLGAIRSCPKGHEITMVVWSNGCAREVTIINTGQ